jgi:hypothetical protein
MAAYSCWNSFIVVVLEILAMTDLERYIGPKRDESLQTNQFVDFLRDNPGNIKEQALQDFIYPRKGLIATIGKSYDIDVGYISTEFNLFNEFYADMVIQSVDRKSVLLVELEPGTKHALFKKRPKREWGAAFEHGYSQVVDWLYRISDISRSDRFRTTFSTSETIEFQGLIIIGRSCYTDAGDALRLDWRKRKSVIDSQHFGCATYDDIGKQNLEFIEITRALRSEAV